MDDYELFFTVDGKEYSMSTGEYGGGDMFIELPIAVTPDDGGNGTTRLRGTLHATFRLQNVRLRKRRLLRSRKHLCSCELDSLPPKSWNYCPNCGGAL